MRIRSRPRTPPSRRSLILVSKFSASPPKRSFTRIVKDVIHKSAFTKSTSQPLSTTGGPVPKSPTATTRRPGFQTSMRYIRSSRMAVSCSRSSMTISCRGDRGMVLGGNGRGRLPPPASEVDSLATLGSLSLIQFFPIPQPLVQKRDSNDEKKHLPTIDVTPCSDSTLSISPHQYKRAFDIPRIITIPLQVPCDDQNSFAPSIPQSASEMHRYDRAHSHSHSRFSIESSSSISFHGDISDELPPESSTQGITISRSFTSSVDEIRSPSPTDFTTSDPSSKMEPSAPRVTVSPSFNSSFDDVKTTIGAHLPTSDHPFTRAHTYKANDTRLITPNKFFAGSPASSLIADRVSLLKLDDPPIQDLKVEEQGEDIRRLEDDEDVFALSFGEALPSENEGAIDGRGPNGAEVMLSLPHDVIPDAILEPDETLSNSGSGLSAPVLTTVPVPVLDGLNARRRSLSLLLRLPSTHSLAVRRKRKGVRPQSSYASIFDMEGALMDLGLQVEEFMGTRGENIVNGKIVEEGESVFLTAGVLGDSSEAATGKIGEMQAGDVDLTANTVLTINYDTKALPPPPPSVSQFLAPTKSLPAPPPMDSLSYMPGSMDEPTVPTTLHATNAVVGLRNTRSLLNLTRRTRCLDNDHSCLPDGATTLSLPPPAMTSTGPPPPRPPKSLARRRPVLGSVGNNTLPVVPTDQFLAPTMVSTQAKAPAPPSPIILHTLDAIPLPITTITSPTTSRFAPLLKGLGIGRNKREDVISVTPRQEPNKSFSFGRKSKGKVIPQPLAIYSDDDYSNYAVIQEYAEDPFVRNPFPKPTAPLKRDIPQSEPSSLLPYLSPPPPKSPGKSFHLPSRFTDIALSPALSPTFSEISSFSGSATLVDPWSPRPGEWPSEHHRSPKTQGETDTHYEAPPPSPVSPTMQDMQDDQSDALRRWATLLQAAAIDTKQDIKSAGIAMHHLEPPRMRIRSESASMATDADERLRRRQFSTLIDLSFDL